MDNIQSLTSQIDRLSHSVNWWNSAIIVMMVVAALAATGLVVTQYVAVRKAQQLSTAQSQLDTAKDSQLKINLKDKELRIADAAKAAGEANAAAASANKEAGIARERASEANKQAARLENENLILQQKLANRRISAEQHRVLVDLLSKKRGQIIIETMADSESGLFAADILKTFEDSGWTIGGKHFPLGVIWTGLIVYTPDAPDALIIAKAFKAAGIPFSMGTEKRLRATIMVGGKPAIF